MKTAHHTKKMDPRFTSELFTHTYLFLADPETQSAAAALAVSVGQLQDPPEVQGMYVMHILPVIYLRFFSFLAAWIFCGIQHGYLRALYNMYGIGLVICARSSHNSNMC
jgi:hypothetical protein